MQYDKVDFENVSSLFEDIDKRHFDTIVSHGLKDRKEPYTMSDHLTDDDIFISIYTIYERGKKKYRLIDTHDGQPPETIRYNSHGK